MHIGHLWLKNDIVNKCATYCFMTGNESTLRKKSGKIDCEVLLLEKKTQVKWKMDRFFLVVIGVQRVLQLYMKYILMNASCHEVYEIVLSETWNLFFPLFLLLHRIGHRPYQRLLQLHRIRWRFVTFTLMNKNEISVLDYVRKLYDIDSITHYPSGYESKWTEEFIVSYRVIFN